MFLGHDRNGHLSGEKVAAMVGRYFIWPGMSKELLEYCSSCSVCQRKSKHRPRKAPAVERPVNHSNRWPLIWLDPCPRKQVGIGTYSLTSVWQQDGQRRSLYGM